MLPTRKIGNFLRGKATPYQVFLAGLLAGVLGFIPGFFLKGDIGGGFLQAPGLILTVFFLVMVLNANLGVFAVGTLVAKLTSMLTLPIAFAIGRFLLDGPTQGLFKALINTPFLAYWGLDHYATAGGLVLGLVFGVAVGWFFSWSLTAFRRKMASLEQNSERFNTYTNKGWSKFLMWLFVGGSHGKLTYQELLDRGKVGNPVRVLGLVAVVLLIAVLWAGKAFFSEPYLTRYTKSGLEAVNGATVDLDKAEIDFASGALTIHNLQITDPKALDANLFAAGKLEAKLDTAALLTRRIVIDKLVSADAKTGVKRVTPGRLIDKPAPPPPPPPDPNQKTLDDYIKEAQLWKERLDQVRGWLKSISGDQAPGEQGKPTKEQIDERVAQEVLDFGQARVVASHLIEGAPLFLLKVLQIHGVESAALPGDLLDVDGQNLSTNPNLVEGRPSLQVKSRSDKLKVGLILGDAKGTPSAVDLGMKGMSVDSMFQKLKLNGAAPMKGGTLDLATTGRLDLWAKGGAQIDLPVSLTFQNTAISLQGAKETPIEKLVLPLGLRGLLTSPSVSIDDQALANALMQAGKAELANYVKQNAGKFLGGKAGELAGSAGGILDGSKTPQQLADEAKKVAEEAARKKLEEERKKVEDEARRKMEEEAKKGLKKLPGDLGGLFGGKKESQPASQPASQPKK
jgi:uncharacterized protein (TIGR03546 family)